MLTHIHIKNFVIVKSLSLDFENGLHVLTGETGAGKSIWIDAIEIGLGARADGYMIYPGEKTCDITVCFNLNKQPDAKAWLASHDFPDDDECIIRRIIDHDKPSRTTINGTPIPQQLIRQFAQFILCIHGQHQHQRLLKSDDQRDLLDRYAKNDDLLLTIQTQHEEWKSLDRELNTLKQQAQNKSSDLTLWQYQLDELHQLHLSENEYDNLFLKYQQLHHGKQFAMALNETLSFIHHDDNPAAHDLTEQALQRINSIHLDDPKIENIKSLLQTAAIHLDEARDALQQYCYDLDVGGDQLDHIERRLAQLQDTARKHHVDPNQLNEVIASLQQKITQLEKADEIISNLEQQQKQIIQNYQKNAKKLTDSRQSAAKKLSHAITAHMQELGMHGGQFAIELPKQESAIHPYGNEKIQFLITTNPGQPPHELSHVVSGGELSRLSLILQMITAQQKNTPTLIFDEVDVGIGGKTADIVGRLLRALSQSAQVLCVTHLPQVAACGHHHYFAEKIIDGKSTSTTMRILTKSERTEELARMLSGAAVTENSLSHAKELLTLHN